MQRVVTGWLFLFFCFPAKAQTSDAELLDRLRSTDLIDSVRVDVLNTLSKNLLKKNPDTAIIISLSAKKLAEQSKYKPGLALALKNIGRGYYFQGKWPETIKTWQQAMEIFRQVNDKTGVANMLSNQGAVYFNQGDDAKSLELHLQSLKISEEISDTLRICTSLINIGAVYLNKEATYKKALEYFLKSYRLSLAIKDPYAIGTATANLGETYFKIGDDATALFYLNQSVKAYEGKEDVPYSMNYIGRVYTRQKEYEKAIQTHMEAFNISKQLDMRFDMAQSLVGVAQAYSAKGDLDASIAAYNQSLEIGRALNAMSEVKDAYEGLSKDYAAKADYGNAFKYQNLLLAIKDTIYNITTDKKLGTLQFTFDIEKKESEITLLNKDKQIQQQEIRRQKFVRNSFMGGFAIVLLFAVIFLSQRNRIAKEKQRGDELLLNILPAETAEELKATGAAKAKNFDLITVLFTDFKNFTQATENLSPEELVAEINHCYSEFDRIITRYGVEKIKTIGDSYMCAGGLPVTNNTHPFDVVSAGLEMAAFIEQNKQQRIAKGQPYFELRIGVHTGPVVAGIVGIKKFAYDIWGDTVNLASRMESSGQTGKVNISGATYELVKDRFVCSHRGMVDAKNKGLMHMYFVESVSNYVMIDKPSHLF